MWIRRISLSLVLLLLVVQHARPEEDDPEPSSIPRLDGKWQQIVRIQNGQPSDKDLIRRRTITFEKNKYTLRDGDQVIAELTVVIDRSKKPMHLDVTFVESKVTNKGLIKFEKGVLTFCMATDDGQRPDKFETNAGDNRILASYKRAKK